MKSKMYGMVLVIVLIAATVLSGCDCMCGDPMDAEYQQAMATVANQVMNSATEPKDTPVPTDTPAPSPSDKATCTPGTSYETELIGDWPSMMNEQVPPFTQGLLEKGMSMASNDKTVYQRVSVDYLADGTLDQWRADMAQSGWTRDTDPSAEAAFLDLLDKLTGGIECPWVYGGLDEASNELYRMVNGSQVQMVYGVGDAGNTKAVVTYLAPQE